jgi:hypothetical protein
MQSSFVGHVERVYSGRHHGSDEAWSICFNTIILLVLNSGYLTQRADLPADSQYAQPFLAAVLNAIRNPHILMTPALINIQAMTLLVCAPFKGCSELTLTHSPGTFLRVSLRTVIVPLHSHRPF